MLQPGCYTDCFVNTSSGISIKQLPKVFPLRPRIDPLRPHLDGLADAHLVCDEAAPPPAEAESHPLHLKG
eukprot:148113-Prorocentrum_minimum.AAC.1